jgi:hypothetical protein
LVPNQTDDQFAPELFYEQCLTFTLQKWHHHVNLQFSVDQELSTPSHASPPSRNPWALQMNLLLPACNSSMDDARGCLFGPPPNLFGVSRRAILDVWCIVYDAVRPHFPNTPLAAQNNSWYAFQEFFGLRSTALHKDSKSAKAFVASVMKPGTLC